MSYSWSHRSRSRWGASLGVGTHPPTPCCPGPSWPWVLALRPAGLLTGQGCLSGRAAGAGDREDGVGHDTINLII